VVCSRMDDEISRLEALKPGVGPGAATPPSWPTEIQRRHFPSRRGAHKAFVSNPLEIDKLSKQQRRLLELLCKADLGSNWGNSGMAPDIRSRRRQLGLDPAGIMEEKIPCAKLGKGSHPRWKALKVALDHFGRLYSTKSEHPQTQVWITENYFDLAPEKWVELWTEVKARAYGITTAWGDPFTAAVAALTKSQRNAWAKRWTAEIMRSPELQLRAWVGGTIARVYEDAGEKAPGFVTAMMRVEDAPAPPLEPARAEPPVTRGKYLFFGKQAFDLTTIDELDPAAKKQFAAAVAKMTGKKQTPKAFFAWEAKQLETSVDGVDVIRWRIALAPAKKQAVFDFWLFPFDDGVLFAAGKNQPLGVAMSQNRFLAEGKKPRPELQLLARELQANRPAKL